MSKLKRHVLTINAGSSSLKSAVFALSDDHILSTDPLWKAAIDWKPDSYPLLTFELPNGVKQSRLMSTRDHHKAFREVLDSIFVGELAILSNHSQIFAIGHRVVHGGASYVASTLITDGVMADLKAFVELAPLHEPANIEGIELSSRIFQGVPQIAVFDTAFHRSMPDSARVYAGPYSWYEELKIQRFGFHGISHQYCSSRSLQLATHRLSCSNIIIGHIGNGVSLSAVKDGTCVMTTMGYTPLEGLVMGTRSGSIDPGIMLHLLKDQNYTVEQLADVLNHESGLLGISGISSDMRDIERHMKNGNERAKLAFQIYVDKLAAGISSLVPYLGGLDILVFAGGIGENSAQVRSYTCKQLGFLGVQIDESKNSACNSDCDVSQADASVSTLVVHTREDLEIARECVKLLC